MTSPAKAEKNSSIFVCARDEVTHISPYLTEEISFSNIFHFRGELYGECLYGVVLHTKCLAATVNDGVWRGRGKEKSRIISTFATGGYGKTAVVGKGAADNKERKLSEICHIRDKGFHSTLKKREIETMLNFELGRVPTLPQGD